MSDTIPASRGVWMAGSWWTMGSGTSRTNMQASTVSRLRLSQRARLIVLGLGKVDEEGSVEWVKRHRYQLDM